MLQAGGSSTNSKAVTRLIGIVFAVCGVSLVPIRGEAQQSTLPTTRDFLNIANTCAAGSLYKFDGDLRRDAANIYEKGRTEGKAIEEIVAPILDRIPESHRGEAYKIYVQCVLAMMQSQSRPQAPPINQRDSSVSPLPPNQMASAVMDPRKDFRGDSIRVSGAEIRIVPDRFAPAWAYPVAYFVVENQTGVYFDAVLVSGSASIGSCRAHTSAGVPMADISNRIFPPQWHSFFVGSRQNVTLTGSSDCVMQEPASNIVATLAVKVGDKILNVPIGASQVPIHGKRN